MHAIEIWFRQRIVRGLKRRRIWRELARESSGYKEALMVETKLIRDAIKTVRKERSKESELCEK